MPGKDSGGVDFKGRDAAREVTLWTIRVVAGPALLVWLVGRSRPGLVRVHMVTEMPLASILVATQGRSSADTELQHQQNGKSDDEEAADHRGGHGAGSWGILPQARFPRARLRAQA